MYYWGGIYWGWTSVTTEVVSSGTICEKVIFNFFCFAVVFFESSFWLFVCYEAQIHWTCFTSISGSFQLCWDWRPAMPNVAPTDGWMLLNGPLVFLKSLNWLSFTLFSGLSLTLFDKGVFMNRMVVFWLRIYPIFHCFLAILSNCCTLPTVAMRKHGYTVCSQLPSGRPEAALNVELVVLVQTGVQRRWF